MAVKRFLRLCDPAHFVKAKDGKGNTVLHLAAIEGHKDIVQLLHEEGAVIDERNNEGRTALMEATLWGRWFVFRYLFEAGSDFRAKDRFGQCAKNFAADTKRNRELRKAYSPEQRVSRFDAEMEAQQRQIISSLLATAMQDTFSAPPNVGKSLFRFIRDKRHILLESVTEWEVDLRKTVGVLIRPQGFPRISTHSGWAHTAWTTDKGDLVVLGGDYWTSRVIELATEVGYKFPEHEYDRRGGPGSYFACHAEKQLMAFFVSKHVFTDSDKRDGHLRELAAIEPQSRLDTATIYVDSEECHSCREFRDHLNDVLGIHIATQYV
jgi:FOG: Ankyrin repeat